MALLPNPPNILLLSRQWTAAQQVIADDWRFDPLSFVLGLAAALLLVTLVYHYRALLVQYRDQAKKKAHDIRQRFSANAAARYGSAVIEEAQTRHLFGGLAPFAEIYVRAQLDAPLAPVENSAPQPSLSPSRAIQASDRLCIIGQSGSGRTTLLYHLLLLQAQKVDAEKTEQVPVYVYLPVLAAELAADEAADSSNGSASVRRLIDTALGSLPRMDGRGVARWLTHQVRDGNALVLLDGWDEVPSTDQVAVTLWIRDFSDANPGNRLVVTAAERGYAPLIEVGFGLLRIAPWTHLQLTRLTQKWAAAWSQRDGDTKLSPTVISYGLIPPTPLEATVELAIQLHGQTPATTPAGKMAQVMALLLPDQITDDRESVAWPAEAGYRALGRLAFTSFEQGRPLIERETIQSVVAEEMSLAPSVFEEEENAIEPEARTHKEGEDHRTLQIVDCCRDLTAMGGPLRPWDRVSYFFAHAQLTAYLVALHAAKGGVSVAAYVDYPAWFDVLRFYVGLRSAEPLIKRLLSRPDDLFLSRLWSAASFLSAAPKEEAAWRAGLTKHLAQLLTNPRLPTLLREQALVALTEGGEDGVELLLRQMTNSGNPSLRAAAVLGLGALGDERDLPAMQAALIDDSLEVRLAAVSALRVLSRRGHEQATELVIAAVIEAEPEVQRAAVTVLAELGPEGHSLLRDAATDEDLIVRRAAVYGLATVGQPWAREMLEKMEREDDQWLVRSAANEALASMGATGDQDTPPLDLNLPQAETEPWLIAWAAERGEGTGTGDAALDTLRRALIEGEAAVRLRAADTLRRLGDRRTIDDLLRALHDPEPLVGQAALEALWEISRRHNVIIKTGKRTG